MKNHSERQITRIIYSSWDFQQALSSITFLIEECDFEKKYNKIELRKFRCFESNFIISMSRPFQKSRGETTLSLKAFKSNITREEQKLIDKILTIRNKIIAHSDESEMYFKSDLISIDKSLEFPIIKFKETLNFEKEEYIRIESLLKKFLYNISKFLFTYSKENPDLFKKFKTPKNL